MQERRPMYYSALFSFLYCTLNTTPISSKSCSKKLKYCFPVIVKIKYSISSKNEFNIPQSFLIKSEFCMLIVTTYRNVPHGDKVLDLRPFESGTGIINLPAEYARQLYGKRPLVNKHF